MKTWYKPRHYKKECKKIWKDATIHVLDKLFDDAKETRIAGFADSAREGKRVDKVQVYESDQ